MDKLICATRPSALALWQTAHVGALLRAQWPHLVWTQEVITTKGDTTLDTPLPEIGGKGLFTLELEQALLSGQVDVAVHSFKDLPTEMSPGLTVAVIPARADARDVLICPAGISLMDLPEGAVVGTSSTRRAAQVLAARPDMHIKPLRGNVDTRIRKVVAGEYDAIILAAAGVQRLKLQAHITEYFSVEQMTPAPGQGALAVQCREGDAETLRLLAPIDDPAAHQAVLAERAFLDALGGGCSLPVGAYATLEENGSLFLYGVVVAPDGHKLYYLSDHGEDPQALGAQLGERMLAAGAGDLLA